MKMFSLLILGILGILIIGTVSAMPLCTEKVEPNTDCEVITPVIDCATYDLYNSTHDLNIDDGTMDQIGTTGVYNFTFNQPDEGTHWIILCDNSTAQIEVVIDNYATETNISDLETHGDSTWATADVSDLATQANVTAINTSIISHGDTSWITATGFSTHDEGDVYNYFTAGSNEDEFKATGFLTGAELNASHGIGLYNGSGGSCDTTGLATQTNITQLKVYGDANWATATGFLTGTELNASHGLGLYNSTGTAANVTVNNTEVLTQLENNSRSIFSLGIIFALIIAAFIFAYISFNLRGEKNG